MKSHTDKVLSVYLDMFVPPNDWPKKYLVTETKKISDTDYEVTYNTTTNNLNGYKIRYKLIPENGKYACVNSGHQGENIWLRHVGKEDNMIYIDDNYIVYMTSLTCVEIHHNNMSYRYRVDDAWPRCLISVNRVGGKLILHLVNTICDDILVVFDEKTNMYIQKCRISNLSCPAHLYVKNNKLCVEVQEAGSLYVTDGSVDMSLYEERVVDS